MSVADRWHKSRPGAGEEKCREHNRAPSSVHGQGDRWQVRWRDENSEQRSRNFRLREGKDPDKHADAFDTQVQASLHAGTYVDPATGDATFQEYAEEWRKALTHGVTTGISVEGHFRLHVYSDPANPGRSRRGGPAIGHRKLRDLAKRPSFIQQWIAGLNLGDATKLKVITWVSAVFTAATEDGLITRNPLRTRSVKRPKADKDEAVPLTPAEVEALAAALRHSPGCAAACGSCVPSRYEILAWLGAATGARQGELFGIAKGDVDFLRRVIHIRRQVKIIRGVQAFAPVKNNKIHDVPFDDSTAVMLAEYIRAYPPEAVTLPWKTADGNPQTHLLLLSRAPGTPMHRKMVNDRWRAALRRAGIPVDRHHMMHVLRHTFVSACLSGGISSRAVAEFTGDTEAVITKTYSHLMPDDRDRARKAIAAFFAGAAEGVPDRSAGLSVH